MLFLHLLGSFSITRDGEPLTGFISNKVQALLVYLAVTDKTHTRDALAGLLWADVPEKVAKHSLRQALSNLRKLVPEGVEITRQTVRAISAEIETDADRFKNMLATGEASAAADLYNGDFLTGFFIADAPEFEAWQVMQREHLHRRAFDLLDGLLNEAQEQLDLNAATDCARRLLVLEPWHEPTHRQLMRLHAQRGDYAAGLAQFAACRQLLASELGVEPDLTTTRLQERIASARNRPIPRRQHAAAELIGRHDELTQLSQLLLGTSRLVTLTGPGGFGKTRLATQLADDLRFMWLDGVYFIPLAPVSAVSSVPRVVAQVIGLETQSEIDMLPQLLRWLTDREVLLILDNCEQLVGDALADFVQQLMSTAPQMSLLVTSRERLNMKGEQLFMLAGLTGEHEAVQLFISAARRQLVDFVPDETDMMQLATICQLVGNVPLALELAAAQIELYSPQEIAAALAAGMETLATTQRNVPVRQRSMTTVFENSWSLLTAAERDLYAALSVFVDGFTLAGARAVAGATPTLMQSLVNKSLLMRKGRRWSQHPLLRQFSAEKLAHTPDRQRKLASAHADYFAQLLNESHSEIQLIKLPALQMIAAEMPNIDQAWRFALANNQISNVAISFRPLAFFYDATNRLQEWQDAFRVALDYMDTQPTAAPDRQNPLLAGILVAYATSLERAAFHADAHEVAQRSHDISRAFGFDEARYHATVILGRTHYFLGSLEASIATLEDAIEIAIEQNDVHGHGRALQSLGGSLMSYGMVDRAVETFQDALARFDEADDQRGVLYAKSMLGQIASMFGQDEAAWDYWNDLLTRDDLASYRFLHGMTHNWIALFNLRHRRFEEALISAEKAVAILKDLGLTSTYFDALVGAGMAAACAGKLDYGWEKEALLRQLAPNLGSPIHYRHVDGLRAVLLLLSGQQAQGKQLVDEIFADATTSWTTKKLLEIVADIQQLPLSLTISPKAI